MRWTREMPKTSGAYWLRSARRPKGHVVEVYLCNEGHPPGSECSLCAVNEFGSEAASYLDEAEFEGCEWFGPLEPPPLVTATTSGIAHPPDPEHAAAVIRFLRGDFRNDGAQGESVHRLCALYEQLAEAHAADLEDMSALVGRVTQVYTHVTGHQIGNVLTTAEAVIQVADAHSESTANFAVECALEPIKAWADDAAHAGHPVEKACGLEVLELLEEELAGAGSKAVAAVASDRAIGASESPNGLVLPPRTPSPTPRAADDVASLPQPIEGTFKLDWPARKLTLLANAVLPERVDITFTLGDVDELYAKESGRPEQKL